MIIATKLLNSVIEYVEKHIAEKIDSLAIEKIACCSYSDVSKLFSFVSEMSISDYIKYRRLTLAGEELKYGKAKVIDTAAKYCYESPVSFARAFKGFHGFNPSETYKEQNIIREFPRIVFQIEAKRVMDPIRKSTISINDKEYVASYYGESGMTHFSDIYSRRQYWRLKDAYEDFKNKPRLRYVLPYNNYPPIDIHTGEVFVIDYYKKTGEMERKVYLSDGTVWKDMPSTVEILTSFMDPIRIDSITINGKEYQADYYGEQDMSSWSDYADKRQFWRLRDCNEDFDKCEKLLDVLPYNNYPPIDIEVGQVFVIDYLKKNGETDRRFYIADGTVWRDMPSTRQIII